MSRRAAPAAAAATEAARAWKRHRQACPPCDTAHRARALDDHCPDGRRLWKDQQQAQAAATAAARAARGQLPGQLALPLTTEDQTHV